MPFIIAKDNTRIYYNYFHRYSKKPVLVFLHGWGVNWTCFKDEIKFFKDSGYPVLYMDLRGHGRSDKPNHVNSYSLELMEEDLNFILKKHDIRRIHLVGHSMGGMIALMFAIKHPTKLKRLVLIDTTYRNPLFSPKVAYLAELRTFAKIFVSFILRHSELRKKHFGHIKEIDFSKMKSRTDTYIALKAFINTPLYSVFATLQAMFRFDVTKKLKSIKDPALVIASEQDQFFTTKIEKMLAGKIERSKLQFKTGTHSIIIKKPKLIAGEIYRFISK